MPGRPDFHPVRLASRGSRPTGAFSQRGFRAPLLGALRSTSDWLTPDWLAAVREAGLGVMFWHEERPDVIRDLYELGIYGICADDPELLLPPQIADGPQ